MKNILKISTLLGVLAVTTFGATSLPAEAHDGWRHETRFEHRLDRRDFAPVTYAPTCAPVYQSGFAPVYQSGFAPMYQSGFAPVYQPGFEPAVYTNHPVVTSILNAIGL